MGIILFFKKWLSADERLTFYASIYTALTHSVENREIMEANEGLYQGFAESIFLKEHDTVVFKERVDEYTASLEKGDIQINNLIKKIDKIAKKNPQWISEIPLEALMMCVIKGEVVQRRVLEYILNLLKESHH